MRKRLPDPTVTYCPACQRQLRLFEAQLMTTGALHAYSLLAAISAVVRVNLAYAHFSPFLFGFVNALSRVLMQLLYSTVRWSNFDRRTQKWAFSCKVRRRPPAVIFLNESLPPKNPLWAPRSWPPWPWFSREKPLKIFKVS
jgi:hypothetical protein